MTEVREALRQGGIPASIKEHLLLLEALVITVAAAALVPGVLKSFDLPDCYRALESKKLRQIEPVGASGVPA